MLPKHRLFPFVSAAPIPRLLERPDKDWIDRFSVTKNRAQTSTPPLLTTARPLETVSERPASTDRLLDQSPGERAMAPIDA